MHGFSPLISSQHKMWLLSPRFFFCPNFSLLLATGWWSGRTESFGVTKTYPFTYRKPPSIGRSSFFYLLVFSLLLHQKILFRVTTTITSIPPSSSHGSDIRSKSRSYNFVAFLLLLLFPPYTESPFLFENFVADKRTILINCMVVGRSRQKDR